MGLRTAALVLYVAGLVGPCLSGCLTPSSNPDAHACCPRPVSSTTQIPRLSNDCGRGADCCSVTGHLRAGSFEMAAGPPPAVVKHAERAPLVSASIPPFASTASTPSPPLRI